MPVTRLQWLVVVMLALAGWLLPADRAAAQTCNVTGTIDFGTVSLQATGNTDLTGSATVSCTNVNITGFSVCATLGVGSGGGTSAAQRFSASAPGLTFALYTDASRTVLWSGLGNPQSSNALTTTAPYNTNTGSASKTVAVYARLFPVSGTAPVGTYTSTFNSNSQIQVLTYGWTCDEAVGSANGTASLTVKAKVEGACTIGLDSEILDFGSTSALNVARTGSLNLKPTCTTGLPYKIGISNGHDAGVTNPAERHMFRDGDPNFIVKYGLYRDSGYTQVWGNDIAGGSNVYSGTGTGSVQSVPVYGKVPAQTTPAAGNYRDTVAVTISY